MIKRHTGDFDDSTVMGCKILATYQAYKNHGKIASFWQGSASYCLWGDNMTVSGTPDKEAQSFIRAVGAKTVITQEKMELDIIEKGAVLVKDLRHKPFVSINANFPEKLQQAYSLFKGCGLPVERHGFILDTSHKIRHGIGCIEMLWQNESLVACALASYVTNNSAIITAVGVAEKNRRSGLGSQVIKTLENSLGGRQVFLLREKENNKEFYERLGYAYQGSFVVGSPR